MKPSQPDLKIEKKSLRELLKSIELIVGNFSNYETVTGPGEDIPFTSKPAQQLLHGLGVPNVIPATNQFFGLPSKKSNGIPLAEKNNPRVLIRSFAYPKSYDMLEITGARIDRLVNSAKVYVNSDIFPKGHYKEIIAPGTLVQQTKDKSPKTGIHLQNMAVGVCHVQEIDLLAEPIITADGRGILDQRIGKIDVNDPAILLLSTPALNMGGGTGNRLTKDQQVQYIESMYRNLFHAAISEGREYIALPAAGLGVFGGDPKTYFSSLMNVAKEFPELNIIYNSGNPKNAPIFDELLLESKLTNIVRTDKDVLFIAHELTKQNILCSFHNPSDADVVLKINDVGQYWKFGKGAGYVGEEHVGAMSSAPLNSFQLNPKAYQNIVERAFLTKPLYTHTEQPIIDVEPVKVQPEISEEKSFSFLELLLKVISNFITAILNAYSYIKELVLCADNENTNQNTIRP